MEFSCYAPHLDLTIENTFNEMFEVDLINKNHGQVNVGNRTLLGMV